jgi:N-acetylmuramoyl-L-alanine amidase
MPRDINLIVVHCSATANGDGLFRGQPGQPGFRTALDAIDEMHAARGFKRQDPIAKRFNPRYQHVGYHFVIACNGAVFTGRDLSEVGAHVAGHNANSVGICMTGTSAFTADQFRSLEAVLRQLNKALSVPLASPRAVRRPSGTTLVGGVCGHRDLSPDLNGDGRITSNEWVKTCPGFDVADYIRNGFVPAREALLLPGAAHA